MLLIKIPKYIQCKNIYNLEKDNIFFNQIFTNSKNVKKNSIFVIDEKIKNIKKYIEEAKNKGAIAIITNKFIKNINLTQFVVKNISLSLDIILNKLYYFKPLNSVAITGTNGKTSVTWYISQICFYNKIINKTFGTLGYYINCKKKNDSNLTTPEYDVLHQSAFLKKKNFYNYIFEVSSHALDQNRLKNFPINIAALTNITQDHLDYHKNFKNYKETKFKLFTKYLDKNGFAILNDKISAISILKKKLSQKKTITYGQKNSDIYLSVDNKKLQVKFFKKKFKVKLSLFSLIELENLSCAIACCYCLNIKIENILKSLNQIINPPGRLEKIIAKKNNFKVFVDYAHTPDALKKILIDQTKNNKKPHVLFGCGGNRDKDKRPKMGNIANRYAAKVYITDDNPREENPSKIRKAILEKCKKGIEINDRKKAISRAIKDLKKNEVLIIAGKGHEKVQINNKMIKFFDDVKIAKEELKKKFK